MLLTSAKNPLVLQAKSLAEKKARTAHGLFLCEGEHMAGEAVAHDPGAVQYVFVEQGREESYAALLASLPPQTPVYEVPAHVLETVSQVKTPQGIAVVSKIPAAAPLTRLGSRLLLLENVQDPGNVGTILRTLDAAGFDGCILTPGCADPYSPKVLRATMGSVLRVPICFTENVLETLLELKESGHQTIASTLDGDPFYQRYATPEKLCLVIGNEGAGIALQTQATCSVRLKLPMRGGAESLNAAVAAAIMMYDFVNR